jgi:RNA polymerase sigma factor (sigma-70 family)
VTARQPPRGDEEALAIAWNRHAEEVRSLCRKWMGGHAEDAKEAFSRAWARIAAHLPQADVHDTRAWLFTVTYRVCMDLHRERARRPEEALDPDEQGEIRLPAPRGENPERAYLEKELAAVLHDAICSLPERLGRAMRAHMASGSYEQIARELDITEVNARKRIQEARSLLRRALADYRAGRPPRRRPGGHCPLHDPGGSPHGHERHHAQ